MKADYDVIVVGAGPVGLWLALELGAQNFAVLLLEKKRAMPGYSMAIGITPPTLELLHRHTLAQAFIKQGVRIQRVHVSEQSRAIGALSFTSLDGPYNFILSLPQAVTSSLLTQRVASLPHVHTHYGSTFVAQETFPTQVCVTYRDDDTGQECKASARYLAGCDGLSSAVRASAGIAFNRSHYRPSFVMADFDDHTGWGPEARLFFSSTGSIESFPLPGHQRRWVVLDTRASPHASPAAYIRKSIQDWEGIHLPSAPCRGESAFRPARGMAEIFARGRVALCGDAAHEMSPIGGQGMNTGFADATLLATILATSLKNPRGTEPDWKIYDQRRKQSFRLASARAARGMWLGTRTGRTASFLRRSLIQRILLHPLMQPRVAAYFAMKTLPPVLPEFMARTYEGASSHA